MDSTADEDLPGELLHLTQQLRAQLRRHVGQGAWAAPGGDTVRPELAAEELAPPTTIAYHDEPAPSTGRRTLAMLRDEIGECTRCKLHATRKKLVFGVGAEDAPLMFVGEAPGEQEDKRGEPFVGPAGELLDKMIEAMGWTRQSVYITNILMSRPPRNRNPEPDEIAACLPFLEDKIRVVAPRIIVALGRPSANTLLANDAPISALRGKFHDRRGVKVMPTFHPAYLLREPDRKRDAWSDLKLVMAELARLGIASPNPSRG
ncbi:MAG: uracil-DNA glycosylase [Kofleriaceae bacterium]|nr:uracil-DNA glycosylase [Kofleriaceae bacterium]